jgi:hypothetical protein
MSNFKQTPASLRYLKARLQVFKRPTVWVSASALLLSIFLVGEYLANPQNYTGEEDLNATTIPPNQNPLGNLPPQNTSATNSELFEALPDLSTVPAQNNADPQAAGSQDDSDPLLQEFLLGRPDPSSPDSKQRRRSSKPPSFATPAFAASPRTRLPETRVPSLYPPASPSPSGVSSAVPGDGLSSLRTVTNPLQSALDRYSPASPSSPVSNHSPQSSSSPLRDSSASGFDSSGQSSLARPEIAPSTSTRPQFTPQLSPSPGTTGYTMPPAFRTPTPYFSGSSNAQPIPGQITPQVAPAVPSSGYGQSGGYGQLSSPGITTPSVVPSPRMSQPVPSPFSVPRSVPGRTTGGGQINTFSNP